MTFAGAGAACWSLIARLDMQVPWKFGRWTSTPQYTPETGVWLPQCTLSDRCPQGIVFTKKRAGLPGSLMRIPRGDYSGCAWCYDGIRTVSITWITPLD